MSGSPTGADPPNPASLATGRLTPSVSYTIKHLREVEDQAPKFGFSETQEARFPQEDLGAETTGLAYHVVRPGRRQAFAHRHEHAEEVYVVTSGSGRIKLDEDVVEVGTMDAIRVAPHVARSFEAGPDGLELLAFGPHHQGDAEMIADEGFWGD
jgi:mannose-6-phosphate isomerase-like protein (cupin superfamily)